MVPSFYRVVFDFPSGEECPIRLEDIEVENSGNSALETRLSVGTCFRYKLSKYKVSKIFTKLHMEDIVASLDGARHSTKVHVHYIVEKIEGN